MSCSRLVVTYEAPCGSRPGGGCRIDLCELHAHNAATRCPHGQSYCQVYRGAHNGLCLSERSEDPTSPDCRLCNLHKDPAGKRGTVDELCGRCCTRLGLHALEHPHGCPDLDWEDEHGVPAFVPQTAFLGVL